MRHFLAAVAVVILAANVHSQEPKALDRQVADALREVHDRGADLYNDGDPMAGYRMYQGGLMLARGVLGHRPPIQKLISDGLSAADREPSLARRTFLLHELIEKVRVELRTVSKKGESIPVPPREVKPPPKPSAGVDEVKEGVVGRVLWQGKPVAGVDVTFVTLGRQPPRVFETTTGSQGGYTVPKLPAGKYVVLITAARGARATKLPERYGTSTTSPLVFDVKAGGEKLDFILQ